MIGYLKGKIIAKSVDSIILLTGGVGYEVYTPFSLLTEIKKGEEKELYIYTHVREDVLSLFGFADYENLEFFKLLLSVSGIGPKVALSIVSSSPVEKLKESISNGDPALLASVSGVGKKTAEKAVVELKGKLGFIGSGKEIFENSETKEVYQALLGLGFKREEITEGIRRLPKEVKGADSIIKELIRTIGRNN